MSGAALLSLISLKRNQQKEQRIKKRYLPDASNPIEMNETLFIAFYRLNKIAFQMILDDITSLLPNSSIPAILQLAAVLRFLAVGSYQGVISNDVNILMGRTTFCKILWKVMPLLERTLCPKWIKIAVNEQSQSASRLHFYEKFGCVDGTLICMTKPPSEHALYFSSKGHYSLNAMMICDHEMRILAGDASRPGSCHDSFVWKMSDAKRYYADLYSEGARDVRLLGDSGYPLKPYLLTPYRNRVFGTTQHALNKKHASARNVVEKTIGVIKSRFRCLHHTLPYVPPKVVTIMNVCCALHNICKYFDISQDEEVVTSISDDDIETPEEDEEYDNAVDNIRDNIARSFNLNLSV